MVKRGHYTEVDAAAITATIFNAMAYVHAHDIVHRDLKTANLLFKNDDGNAELLIVDFGLARSTLDQQEDTKEDKQALLNTWKVGTQYYQAPEVGLAREMIGRYVSPGLTNLRVCQQIVAKKPYYGKPADVFCLGQITYTLLSGVNPFWEAPPHELDKYVKQGKWTFHPRSFNKVSEEGKDFIKRCLETDPERRMTTDQAMRHPWIMKYCPPVGFGRFRLAATNWPLADDSNQTHRPTAPGSSKSTKTSSNTKSSGSKKKANTLSNPSKSTRRMANGRWDTRFRRRRYQRDRGDGEPRRRRLRMPG